jgi:isoquinoline 1-oxidoreductase alpha subunit
LPPAAYGGLAGSIADHSGCRQANFVARRLTRRGFIDWLQALATAIDFRIRVRSAVSRLFPNRGRRNTAKCAMLIGINAAASAIPDAVVAPRSEMLRLTINGQSHEVDVDPDTPLLWVLRDTLGMTGTKYGCGIAQCGACTVHVDGAPVRSCTLPVSAATGKHVGTIEGLAANGTLHKVQKAWIEHDVPQCGYCQSGMIMAVAALLRDKPKPTDADIDAVITNICRCGTYQRIRAAIHDVAVSA